MTLLASAAFAQAAAPSDEPTPAERPEGVAKEGPLRLKGFDVELSLTSSSGVYFSSESYTNSLSLAIDPSFAIGRRFFEGRWLEPLVFAVHFPVEFELAGSDARFRGRGFSSTALFDAPEQAAIDQSARRVSGLTNQRALIGDLWLGLSHAKLVTIPKIGIQLGAGLRAVLPTSISSRNAGLYTAASLGVFAEKQLGPVNVGYSARPTKYFYSRTSPRIVPLSDTVLVNGKEEPVWRPDSTGVNNPDWGLVHGLAVDVELPRGFGVSVSYLLLHTAPLKSATCLVEGVPGADTCRDGVLVGDVRGAAFRNDHWFTAEASWKARLATVALGLSTYRPVRADGGGYAQPFYESNANNFTTLYLTISAGAEQLASAFLE